MVRINRSLRETDTSLSDSAPPCPHCRRLEAENARLREMMRMVAAIADREELVESMLEPAARPTRRA